MVGDRHEAEDVVQDTFRSAWMSRERFEAERGDRAWLLSILRRRIVDRWRRHPKWTISANESTAEIVDPRLKQDSDGYTDEMQAALSQLPADLREALLLVVVGELTHREAAEVLNVPLGTVLSRVSRARVRLREYLISSRT